ncbi:class F sortase [Streptomyces roseolus]|uniref:class F sortase n=1 Tax=Streptomyces roseolus TaxID=67358 RepID=UPI0037B35A49
MAMPVPRLVRLLALATALVGVLLTVRIGVLLAREDPGAAPDFGSVPTRTASPPADHAVRAARREVPAEPSDISVPRLRLRAPVDRVGVTPDGQVHVPDDPGRVGWYRFSPAPGAPAGSSVLVGHVDATGRGLGVLAALDDVREGDRVVVGRRDGTTVSYRVTARRTIAKQALAGSGVFRREGAPVLTLVTCAGPYLPGEGGYRNNLVVTAVEAPR